MISAVIQYKDQSVSIHSSETNNVGKVFGSGFYEANTDQNGNLKIRVESLNEIHLPYKTKENRLLVETVNNFFASGVLEKINKLGFTHKLGILLHGKQGTGKTSVLNFIAKKVVEENGGIVFFCNDGNTLQSAIGLSKMIREIQANPIIFIADEFERYAKNSESEMKNFLDGKDSIQNTLFLAATNYIDKVPNTLKERPSRFKIVQEVKGITDKNLMKAILKTTSDKIDPNLFSSEDIETIVKDIKETTLDELKHICLDKATNSYVPKKLQTIGFKKQQEEDTESSESPNFYNLGSYWTTNAEPTVKSYQTNI